MTKFRFRKPYRIIFEFIFLFIFLLFQVKIKIYVIPLEIFPVFSILWLRGTVSGTISLNLNFFSSWIFRFFPRLFLVSGEGERVYKRGEAQWVAISTMSNGYSWLVISNHFSG